MKIVADVNVIIAALLANSTSRKLLLSADAEFYFPAQSLVSLHKYEEELIQKSGLSRDEYVLLKSELFAKIALIPNEAVSRHIDNAFDIMGAIDDEDVTILAGAFAVSALIWSQDKHFERQDKIHVLKTADMVKLFGDTV